EVRLWDAATGLEVPHPEAPAGPVNALAFSADGTLLVLGGEGEGPAVRAWGVAEAEGGWRVESRWAVAPGDKVLAVAVAPDGRTVATGGQDEQVKLWDAAKGDSRGTLGRHQGAVAALAFSPTGNVLASGGYDKAVKLWNVRTGEELPLLRGDGRHQDW